MDTSAQGEAPRRQRRAGFFEELAHASSADLARLHAGLGQRGLSQSEQRFYSNLIFHQWAGIDPKGAADYFQQLPVGAQIANAQALSAGWAEFDAPGAAAWAETIPQAGVRGVALAHALAKLAENDPQGAIAKLNATDPATAKIAGVQMFADWADRDPAEALKNAQALAASSPIGDAGAIAVAQRWATNDPAAALKALATSTPQLTLLESQLAATVIATAAGNDPAGTVAALAADPPKSNANLAQAMALKIWLQRDAAAAGQWFEAQSPDMRSQLILGATRTSGNSPDGAVWLPLIEGMAGGDARTSAFQAILKGWSATQPEQALQYLANAKDKTLAAAAYPMAIQGMALSDPEFAFKTARALPQSPSRGEAVAMVASTWVYKDPGRATAEIAGMPDGPEKSGALSSAAITWARLDAAAASAWAAQLPDSPARNTALANISSMIATSSPVLARNAAMAISDAQGRQRALDRLDGVQRKAGSK